VGHDSKNVKITVNGLDNISIYTYQTF